MKREKNSQLRVFLSSFNDLNIVLKKRDNKLFDVTPWAHFRAQKQWKRWFMLPFLPWWLLWVSCLAIPNHRLQHVKRCLWMSPITNEIIGETFHFMGLKRWAPVGFTGTRIRNVLIKMDIHSECLKRHLQGFWRMINVITVITHGAFMTINNY